MEGATSVAIANLTDVSGGIGKVLVWFWGIFGNLIDSIASNPLLLWGAGFAIVCGVVGAAVAVIRKFGIKRHR